MFDLIRFLSVISLCIHLYNKGSVAEKAWQLNSFFRFVLPWQVTYNSESCRTWTLWAQKGLASHATLPWKTSTKIDNSQLFCNINSVLLDIKKVKYLDSKAGRSLSSLFTKSTPYMTTSVLSLNRISCPLLSKMPSKIVLKKRSQSKFGKREFIWPIVHLVYSSAISWRWSSATVI